MARGLHSGLAIGIDGNRSPLLPQLGRAFRGNHSGVPPIFDQVEFWSGGPDQGRNRMIDAVAKPESDSVI
jgi:hypothetical protein